MDTPTHRGFLGCPAIWEASIGLCGLTSLSRRYQLFHPARKQADNVHEIPAPAYRLFSPASPSKAFCQQSRRLTEPLNYLQRG
ncbi:hypothetical protein [Rosenbergiella collisarenosi]|uniref:hypothetical protein n=1 Tax=Rosenbergiella collisarenosi TaxID=1544695 RepID=UPI001BDB07A3|nr:hypothetical protein [Rosenbergiella collisarenosi]